MCYISESLSKSSTTWPRLTFQEGYRMLSLNWNEFKVSGAGPAAGEAMCAMLCVHMGTRVERERKL